MTRENEKKREKEKMRETKRLCLYVSISEVS